MANMNMDVLPLRKGGKGIKGTYANIDHHAEAIKPFVDILAPSIQTMNFKRWRQGHNVHVFETKDGRQFDLVPLRLNGEYTGVRFRIRLSRSHKVVLMDCPTVHRITQLIVLMQAVSVAIDPTADTGGGIND